MDRFRHGVRQLAGCQNSRAVRAYGDTGKYHVHDISQCRRKPEQLDCFDNLQVGAHRGETDPYE